MDISIDYESLSSKGDTLISLAESLVGPRNTLNTQYLEVMSNWKGQEIPALSLAVQTLISNIDNKIETFKQKGQLLKTYASMYKSIESIFASDGSYYTEGNIFGTMDLNKGVPLQGVPDINNLGGKL